MTRKYLLPRGTTLGYQMARENNQHGGSDDGYLRQTKDGRSCAHGRGCWQWKKGKQFRCLSMYGECFVAWLNLQDILTEVENTCESEVSQVRGEYCSVCARFVLGSWAHWTYVVLIRSASTFLSWHGLRSRSLENFIVQLQNCKYKWG